MRATYVATFIREEKYVVAKFPDLGIACQGNDLLGAVRKAEEMLGFWLNYHKEQNINVPEPRTQFSDIPKETGLYPQWVTVDY